MKTNTISKKLLTNLARHISSGNISLGLVKANAVLVQSNGLRTALSTLARRRVTKISPLKRAKHLTPLFKGYQFEECSPIQKKAIWSDMLAGQAELRRLTSKENFLTNLRARGSVIRSKISCRSQIGSKA